MLVVVDEPLLEQGSQLVATVADAGGRARLEVWTGPRPLEHAPPAVLDGADHSSLSYFLAEKPLAEEAAARFELIQRMIGHGGRQIFMAFVDAELLEGELSRPAPDLAGLAERLLAQVRDAEHLRAHRRRRAPTSRSASADGRGAPTSGRSSRAARRTTPAARSTWRRTPTAPTGCSSPT